MRRFWTWFDRLESSRKLFLVLLFLAVGLGTMGLGFEMKEPNPYLIFGGLFFIIGFFSSGALFFNKKEKSERFKARGRHL